MVMFSPLHSVVTYLLYLVFFVLLTCVCVPPHLKYPAVEPYVPFEQDISYPYSPNHRSNHKEGGFFLRHYPQACAKYGLVGRPVKLKGRSIVAHSPTSHAILYHIYSMRAVIVPTSVDPKAGVDIASPQVYKYV